MFITCQTGKIKFWGENSNYRSASNSLAQAILPMGKGLGKSSFNYISNQDKQEMALSKQNMWAACPKEQALLGALAAGWEKEGELATTSLLWNLDSTSNSRVFPSTELSDFHQSAQSGNKQECKQTLKNTCKG